MTSRQWPASRGCTDRRGGVRAFALALLLLSGATVSHAAEPPSCRVVRLADVGWLDVTATTSVLGRLLQDLGYEPTSTLLSVPVTFASMQAGNIDAFLGNWMPAQVRTREPYIADRSIEVVRPNLVGAKYTLAVPAYAYAAGLHDFADIARYATQLHQTIYGIESGNDGNRHILAMIQNNEYGLGSFHIVESSEQGMLAEVARAYAAKEPIVFLGLQ